MTTIKNEQKLFSVTTTTGNITVTCEARLNGDNSLAGISQGQINDSVKGNLGSFTAGEMGLESVSAQSPLRANVNINNVSDLAACNILCLGRA